MMPAKRPSVLLLLPLVLALGGCPASEEVEEPAKPAVAFEGQKDPRMVGTWVSPDGRSTYRFDQDGSYNIRAKVTTPGGLQETNVNGKWLVKGDLFLMRNDEGGVVPYDLSLKGSDLTLTSTGSLKSKTVLKKK